MSMSTKPTFYTVTLTTSSPIYHRAHTQKFTLDSQETAIATLVSLLANLNPARTYSILEASIVAT